MLIYSEPLPAWTDMLRLLLASKVGQTSEAGLFFSKGREGLLALSSLFGANKKIWLPAYICDELAAYLKQAGRSVNYYEVDDNLAPRWDQLEKQASESIFVLVHYFGFLNNLEDTKRFCASTENVLIEDRAHMLPFDEKSLIGEGAVYCWRKFLPIPDGAAIQLRNKNIARNLNIEKSIPWKWLARVTVKKILKATPSWIYGYRKLNEETYEAPATKAEYPINSHSLSVINGIRQNITPIIKKRRENYQLLSELMAPLNIKPLFALSNTDCPYVFPFKSENRDSLISGLRKRGIAAQFWPTLPPEVKGNLSFPVANSIANELILLPVHQDITPRDIRRIVQSVTAVVKDAA